MGEQSIRVPSHLRRYVVEQDYAAYSEVDHAVWRFVLLQLEDRLRAAAHPAYARGLAETGMSVERIPRISEMDACLGRFGWSAVCVDGFIPPRAFQEFQALGILPIAAEIRSVEHLPYTPAPDVIHEAAGHAPILPDPEYAAFLRRIGECGMRAFAAPRDTALYQAIYRLSVVKERADAARDEVEAAERALSALAAQPFEPSEAARLSRLYWWTVEYGLVGTPEDYKLFGAGLLSSLGESYFCHAPVVKKLALSRDCVEVDYDITRPQPQLFVARDFAQLGEVLDEVCAGMAFRRGGLDGLAIARDADEVATIELDSGVELTGNVADVLADAGEARLCLLRGACAVGERGRLLPELGPLAHPSGLWAAFGALADGRELAQLTRADLARLYGHEHGLELPLPGGLRVTGELERVHEQGDSLRVCALRAARVVRGSEPIVREPSQFVWLAGERVTGVRAGASDPDYWPGAEYPHTKSPARGPERLDQAARRRLYERVARARGRARPEARRELAAVHGELQRGHAREWLLRWNLLECLSELELDPPRRAELVRELVRLEHALEGKYPVAMGLRYLGYDQAPRSRTSV